MALKQALRLAPRATDDFVRGGGGPGRPGRSTDGADGVPLTPHQRAALVARPAYRDELRLRSAGILGARAPTFRILAVPTAGRATATTTRDGPNRSRRTSRSSSALSMRAFEAFPMDEPSSSGSSTRGGSERRNHRPDRGWAWWAIAIVVSCAAPAIGPAMRAERDSVAAAASLVRARQVRGSPTAGSPCPDGDSEIVTRSTRANPTEWAARARPARWTATRADRLAQTGREQGGRHKLQLITKARRSARSRPNSTTRTPSRRRSSISDAAGYRGAVPPTPRDGRSGLKPFVTPRYRREHPIAV